ncbi:MAG: hypothetical protein R3266_05585, partial [Gemmatimonadota bacterium]|nr:hypothetical protein [Gemmatimonadota bacterium]
AGFPLPAEAQPADTVRVVLTLGGAAVEQRLAPEGDDVRAWALRLPGQTLDIYEVVREGERLLDATLTKGERAYEFAVTSGAPVVIRYSVEGGRDRIPIFVAGGIAELTVAGSVEEPWLVRLDGPASTLETIDLATSLPRLAPAPDEGLEASLSSLPSLVRLSTSGAVSFARIADAVALLLIALGAAWAWRTARIEPSRRVEVRE